MDCELVTVIEPEDMSLISRVYVWKTEHPYRTVDGVIAKYLITYKRRPYSTSNQWATYAQAANHAGLGFYPLGESDQLNEVELAGKTATGLDPAYLTW